MIYSNLVERAASFAAEKHKNQRRKEGGLLYISHLFGVALILQKYNYSETVIAAGLLHDTLEDTDTTETEIVENFGQEILELILQVTNDDSLSWKEKKQKYVDTVRVASAGAQAIALADKIHNMKSLLINLEDLGEDIVWSFFNARPAEKLWFEEACLQMFQETFSGPATMLIEYEAQIADLKTKYF
jgi:(p)ppGpp synthase/HD superfamily hydrolase